MIYLFIFIYNFLFLLNGGNTGIICGLLNLDILLLISEYVFVIVCLLNDWSVYINFCSLFNFKFDLSIISNKIISFISCCASISYSLLYTYGLLNSVSAVKHNLFPGGSLHI